VALHRDLPSSAPLRDHRRRRRRDVDRLPPGRARLARRRAARPQSAHERLDLPLRRARRPAALLGPATTQMAMYSRRAVPELARRRSSTRRGRSAAASASPATRERWEERGAWRAGRGRSGSRSSSISAARGRGELPADSPPRAARRVVAATDGYLDPSRSPSPLADGAGRGGCSMPPGTRVCGIDVDRGRVHCVADRRARAVRGRGPERRRLAAAGGVGRVMASGSPRASRRSISGRWTCDASATSSARPRHTLTRAREACDGRHRVRHPHDEPAGRPAPADSARPRLAGRARRGLRRDGGLGAGALARGQRGRGDPDGATAWVGRAPLVAGHRRGAPRVPGVRRAVRTAPRWASSMSPDPARTSSSSVLCTTDVASETRPPSPGR
jgi:hypothetical protein